jgi:PPOX class probable F420-dependent enzyme
MGMADLELVRRLVSADRGLAVVATTRSDGTVHASVVNAGLLDDPVGDQPVAGFVARGSAKKLALLRRSGRATLVWRSGWEWVAVEGAVRLAGPDDPLEGIDPRAVPNLLRAVFAGAGGSHDDWDTFDRVMADERRVAVLVSLQRITTNN